MTALTRTVEQHHSGTVHRDAGVGGRGKTETCGLLATAPSPVRQAVPGMQAWAGFPQSEGA